MTHSRTHGAHTRTSHTRTRASRTRRGVTLMELIVALTITGFMAAIGTTAFGSIIDQRRMVRESTSADERAAALRQSIREWLVPATVQIERGGVPRTGTTTTRTAQTSAMSSISTRTANGAEAVSPAAAAGDVITFTTTAPNPTDAPNARLRLFVDGDEATPERGLVLEYQVTQQMPLQRRELDSTITTLTVEYLDRTTGKWYPASEAATLQTIRAVRLTLTGDDPKRVSALLQVPIILLLNGVARVVTQ